MFLHSYLFCTNRVKANNKVFKTNKRPVVKTNKRPVVKTNKRPVVKTNKRPNKPRVTSTAVNLNRNINHVVVKKPRRPVYIKRPTLKRPGFFGLQVLGFGTVLTMFGLMATGREKI